MADDIEGAGSAFSFHGNWREYAGIAFPNLLLTIVTLGIYRFWGTTRARRYLWGHSHFIGDPLEWTGTGKELFVGFLLALVLLGLPILVLQFGVQAMILRGHIGMAFLVGLIAYTVLIYVIGLARFRALRYRLSRSYWRGIRGGSDDQGFDYAISALWKPIVGSLALGLMIPWSMVSLWNERWRLMSFGPLPFSADASWRPIMGRYLLFYLLPVAGCFGMVGISAVAIASGAQGGSAPALMGIIIGAIAGYAALGAIAIAYYAAFFREAVGTLELGDLCFSFTARTMDWVKLILGHIGLVIVTLGIGYIFLAYRNWAFLMRHMEATGEISLSGLTQSETRMPTQGEGLLDALDVGAF